MERYLQSSKTQNKRNRKLRPPFHLHIPQQDTGKDGQCPIRDNGNGREVEADAAVELIVARAVGSLAPKGRDGVAEVGDGNDKYDRCGDRRTDDSPERVDEAATGIRDTKQTYANASLDGYCAGRIKEFSDEEKLIRLSQR